MLIDESINVAQSLLSKQFPKVCGFQETVIGKLQEFDVIPTEKNYIQILHDSSLHWVCVANMESRKKDNEIHYLYDSLKKKHISKDVTAQIASYAYHPGPQLTILSKSVQQQGNGVDCGVYAIAFTTSRAYGSNPGKESYDEKKIRPHLVECLKIGKLTPFPTITGEVVRCDTATSNVELYCLCRVPYAPPTDERYEMAQCNQCKEQFHRVCEKIPALAFENLRKKCYYTVCRHRYKQQKRQVHAVFNPFMPVGNKRSYPHLNKLELLPYVTIRNFLHRL